MATPNPYYSHQTASAHAQVSKTGVYLLRAAWITLIGLALLIAVYLPVNNIVEYWPLDAEVMSLHFVIFSFVALLFFVLSGRTLWAKASTLARWLGSLALVGWLIDLFIISNNQYLQNTPEAFVVGSMIIVAPCCVLLLDRRANKIREKLRWRNLQHLISA